ncbi:MAG TPA: substrate-binding domain-containing protein [Euzebyales bacterium]
MQERVEPNTRRSWLLRGAVALSAIVLGVLVGFALVGFDIVDRSETTSTAEVGSTASQSPDASCPSAEQAELVVAAAPEIAAAVRNIAREAAERASLRCVQIEVRGVAPPTVRDALSRGWNTESDGPAPHVWIPTTSTELALAAGTRGVGDMLDVSDAPSVARSPSVIAMPQPMADELGWPEAGLSWETVANLSAADNAWAERDREQWGAFRISLVENVAAEPTISAVSALTRAVGALPTGDTEQSEEARFEAQAQLLLLERRVEYLGTTTNEQLEQLRAVDENDELLRTVSAIPLTEQMVWLYNGGGRSAAPDTPLAVWYPEDGASDADYPFARLQVPWADEGSDEAAAALLEAMQAPEGAERLAAAGFRGSSRETTPELIEAGGMRPDLAPPEPEPVPALIVGPLTEAWRGLSQTGNLLAVIDVSGSMVTEVPGTGASRLELSAQGMAAGIQLLDPASSAGIWEFSTRLNGDQDHRELVPLGQLSDQFRAGTRQQAAVAAIRGLQPREDTGLFDTIAASYEHMLDNYETGRLNAVIFFTDGQNDDDDGISLQQLQARLRDLVDPQRPVLFIGVGYGPEADFGTLESVTAITGGRLYELDRPEDIRNVFIDVQTGDLG